MKTAQMIDLLKEIGKYSDVALKRLTDYECYEEGRKKPWAFRAYQILRLVGPNHCAPVIGEGNTPEEAVADWFRQLNAENFVVKYTNAEGTESVPSKFQGMKLVLDGPFAPWSLAEDLASRAYVARLRNIRG